MLFIVQYYLNIRLCALRVRNKIIFMSMFMN